jgi:hypothetical protein
MRRLILAMLCVSTAAFADDARQLATMPAPAQESVRADMRDSLIALNEVLTLIAAGKIREAGEVAEASLGETTMGKHRAKPFDARPGAHMPQAMHGIGMGGHKAASEFAKAAASGDRDRAIALLPNLTSACVGCHSAYRIR